MGFSEKVRLEARKRAAFRCCICHKLWVEVHHIIPQSEGGADTLDNAAPLCASCHDLLGGNPDKRRQVKQMRDAWWEAMARRAQEMAASVDLDSVAIVDEDPEAIRNLSAKGILIYHCVFSHETFEESAKILFELVSKAAKKFPRRPRHLFLDIEGHRNKAGGFDRDMFELQAHFILGFLMPFLNAAHLPLIGVRNRKKRRDDLDGKLEIFGPGKVTPQKNTKSNAVQSMYLADTGRWY